MGIFDIIGPKMQHIVFYASFSMSYVFLYLIGLAQIISFFYNLPKSEFKLWKIIPAILFGNNLN